MCLTVPVKILEIKKNKAIAIYPNPRGKLVKKEKIDIQLVKDIKIGDYGLISNGFIIKKISAKEAEKILNILKK